MLAEFEKSDAQLFGGDIVFIALVEVLVLHSLDERWLDPRPDRRVWVVGLRNGQVYKSWRVSTVRDSHPSNMRHLGLNIIQSCWNVIDNKTMILTWKQ